MNLESLLECFTLLHKVKLTHAKTETPPATKAPTLRCRGVFLCNVPPNCWEVEEQMFTLAS